MTTATMKETIPALTGFARGLTRHIPSANQADVGRDAVPTNLIAIHLPADQYLHIDAPSEWWWHTGTLKTSDRRIFGFEINAASFAFKKFGFTQVMLTDVKNNAHYQQTEPAFSFNPNTWAESDPNKDWWVKLKDVSMSAPQSDPTKNMKVTAKLTDSATNTEVDFDLKLSQEGPPFIVWATGVLPTPPNSEKWKNNYYYSLTRLQATGSISIKGERFDVSGVTWMDHEYGLFEKGGQTPKWILQDMQLDNGVCISNYSTSPPKLNKKLDSLATVQLKDGTTRFVKSTVTPAGRTWTSLKSKATYFMQLKVEIPTFNATIQVESLVDSQEFYKLGGAVYEGVAGAKGTFEGKPVSGTAWNEQTL